MEERHPRRDAAHTRRSVLEAALQVISERGAGFTLADVADAAGYSKGGLLHHFPSRDDLLVALVEDANERFKAAVMSHLDLSENRPGKLLRAYVRALCGGSPEAMQYFSSSPLWSGTLTAPGVAQTMKADAEWWQEQLLADGLDPNVARIVQRASEGFAAALSFGEETEASLAEVRSLLLRMTES